MTPLSTQPSRTAHIRALALRDAQAAEAPLAALLADLFAINPLNLKINLDQYSLNSLNGFFDTQDGAFFFKFHQEEGEEGMTGEYYRADILARAGLPVDQPVLMSTLPGEQILIYRRRDEPRFSDVLRTLDLADEPAFRALAVEAERALSQRLIATYRATLHPISPVEASAEPIHRLFHERLIDRAPYAFPGGRYRDFYVGQSFPLPGHVLEWEDLSTRRFTVNGVTYASTLAELFTAAEERLRPERLADAGGVVAHGDAHNANVWFSREGERATLSYFDPAFAGEHVPSLLAEIKTSFHNIFAHPFWLYEPVLASERFSAEMALEPGRIIVETDWRLSPIRTELLAVKAREVWRPLLAELRSCNMLPSDWRQVIRLGLFLCPTLVMNLRAGVRAHTEISSLIGLCVAVMVGSEPMEGNDTVTRFLEAIDPDRRPGL